jgi:L-aspartate oxidase
MVPTDPSRPGAPPDGWAGVPVGRAENSMLDLLVLGSGVAGLSAAVRASDTHGMRVGVLTKGELHQSTTRWAQGGVAAVLHEDPDSTDLHLADTLSAGAGLCDADAVRVLVDEGPGRVNELIGLGAMFDRDEAGRLELAREGGHSLPRVVHAGGAATGAEIERALVEAALRTAAVVLENTFALDLLVEGERVVGVRALDSGGVVREVGAHHVLLATGGAGQLFSVTTNPVEATGDGVAMALRAGVAVADLEFVQFHPTALHDPRMPRPLLSEALRGHGAFLRDAEGERFVDELLPRDEVSRAMTRRMREQGVDHLWLDATGLEAFAERFPTITAELRPVGLDPTRDWLPIAPAAHYLCGGIVTDLHGAASRPGLWAAGEVACSGVHGANRLASNSLLEGMVFGSRVVEAIEAGTDRARPTGAMRSVFDGQALDGQALDGRGIEGGAGAGSPVIGGRVLPPASRPVEGLPGTMDASTTPSDVGAARDRLQRAMTVDAGVVRSAASLADASREVATLATLPVEGPRSLELEELRNLRDVANVLLRAATTREESRGAHTRDDFPTRDDERFRVRLIG